MSNYPLISVVMPIYNTRIDYLQDSVNSILNQSYDNFELLCIIDPVNLENDDVVNALEEIKNDKRLKIYKNKVKKGFIGSLNYGCHLSKGEYIARMDSDDISYPKRFEIQINELLKRKIDFLGSWAVIIDENNKIIGKIVTPVNYIELKSKILLHNPFLHGSMIFKKSAIKNIGYYDVSMFGAEDYYLWMKAIYRGYIFANINNFLIKIRRVNNSIMRGTNWRRTRFNYIKAKYNIINEYGFRNPLSFVYFISSFFSIYISPKNADYIKKIIF